MTGNVTHTNTLIAGCLTASLALLGGCTTAGDLGAGAMGDAFAAAAGIPQIDAFLPYAAQVPAGAATPIDGDWTISTINKTIRIEGGRAYAIDPWNHGLALKIRPNMVVLQDIKQLSETQYTAYNLPFMADADMQIQPDGSIAVQVNGVPPYSHLLIRENGMTAAAPPATSQPPVIPPTPVKPEPEAEVDLEEEGYPECPEGILDLDPITNEVICVPRYGG